MILSIKNYVFYNISELFKKGHLIVGMLAGLVPALIMVYFILEGDTSFGIKHVSNFYCMLGMLAAVLHPLYFVNRDYSSKTISLINNSKQNRKNYVLANSYIALFVSLLYATVGLLLILVASQLGVPGGLTASFLVGFFVNVFLLVLTYFLFVYVLLLYGVRSATVYVILTALLLFVHNILSNVLIGTQNKFLSSLIENFPAYFYPVMVGSNPLSPLQYYIGILSLLVLFSIVLSKSRKIEI